jgi:general secretion pathway protein E
MGCDNCQNSGHRGRLPLYEIIEVDGDLERMMHEGQSEASLIAAARARGPGILEDGIAKMRAGMTTAQEVARAIHEGAVLPPTAQDASPAPEAD